MVPAAVSRHRIDRSPVRSSTHVIGTTLEHYRITSALGAGGMGVVYRAIDTRLGREVALKVLPVDVSSSRDRLERFQREARTVAALNHPHIVTIHSIEEAGGIHFLTMELVEGQSLDRVIPSSGFPIERILEIGVAVAAAVAAAHEKGIVHRDLKPANVMVANRQGRTTRTRRAAPPRESSRPERVRSLVRVPRSPPVRGVTGNPELGMDPSRVNAALPPHGAHDARLGPGFERTASPLVRR